MVWQGISAWYRAVCRRVHHGAGPLLRAGIVICGVLMIVALRWATPLPAVLCGAMHILIIALAAFWFGLRGSALAAVAGVALAVLEGVRMVPPAAPPWYWLAGLYAVAGILLGVLRDREQAQQSARQSALFQKTLAYHDPLTGCVNFRWLMQHLADAVARAARYGQPLSVVIVDIDRLQDINHTYGLLAGDDALRRVATVLMRGVRAVDVVGRFEDDAFVLLLHETLPEQAAVLLERVRSQQRALPPLPYAAETADAVPFSAGIAAVGRNGSAVPELLDAAENALLRAKQAGGNRDIIERRQSARSAPRPGVAVTLSGLPCGPGLPSLRVVDIGTHGAQVVFDGEPPAAACWCRISQGDDVLAEVQCRVVRRAPAGAAAWLAGMRFTDQIFREAPRVTV